MEFMWSYLCCDVFRFYINTSEDIEGFRKGVLFGGSKIEKDFWWEVKSFYCF